MLIKMFQNVLDYVCGCVDVWMCGCVDVLVCACVYLCL